MPNQDNSPIKIIKAHLDERAKSDPQFAVSYAKENKSIEQCWSYIMGEARKRATGSSCYMTDQEVFGLAVHFYDEDDLEIKSVKGKCKTSAKTTESGSANKSRTRKESKVVKKMAAKPSVAESGSCKPKARKIRKPEKKVVQLDLFNFDEL